MIPVSQATKHLQLCAVVCIVVVGLCVAALLACVSRLCVMACISSAPPPPPPQSTVPPSCPTCSDCPTLLDIVGQLEQCSCPTLSKCAAMQLLRTIKCPLTMFKFNSKESVLMCAQAQAGPGQSLFQACPYLQCAGDSTPEGCIMLSPTGPASALVCAALKTSSQPGKRADCGTSAHAQGHACQ